jgi:hypothetical protein
MALRRLAVALSVAALSFVPFLRSAQADEEPPYAPYTAPVYMIISFDDTFVVGGPHPSHTIMANIGSFVGGAGFIDTQFVVNQTLQAIQFPDGRHDPTFAELSNNSATIVGSFQTSDLLQIHMVTPASGTISPDIQAAVFTASHAGALDALLASTDFPTTVDIADVVAEYLPQGTSVTSTQLLSALFNSGEPLGMGESAVLVGEGEMFPHAPDSASLFHYELQVAEDGTVTTDFCLRVGVDVHPGSTTNPVNVKSKNGVVPIAILSEPGFDALDVDPTTATIGGVSPTQWTTSDVDDDGDDDLLLKWDVPELVAAGALSLSTTSLTMRAERSDGSCVIGTDSITATKK